MTYSIKKVQTMEFELRMWWRLSMDCRSLARHRPNTEELAELIEEIDTLADMTDWPAMRQACIDTLTSIVKERPAVAVA